MPVQQHPFLILANQNLPHFGIDFYIQLPPLSFFSLHYNHKNGQNQLFVRFCRRYYLLMLASGDFNHIGSGENRQFWVGRK